MRAYPPSTYPKVSRFRPDWRAPYMRAMVAQMNDALVIR
jgi:hypothetical protein